MWLRPAPSSARSGPAAARFAEQLAEARPAALRLQVRPQFVYDTLHAIGERMHGDVDAAERLVLELAAYQRSVLALGDETTVPLRDLSAGTLVGAEGLTGLMRVVS